jgi:hypothetical protein
MKRKLLTVLATCLVLAGTYAQALTITPSSGPIVFGNETSTSAIQTIISSYLGSATSLYKADVGNKTNPATIESGSLAGNYNTDFSNQPLDPMDATITNSGNEYIGPESYLLVKDGNATPAWYLFWLAAGTGSLGWDGKQTLELKDFWPGQGAISHVELFGTSSNGSGGGGGPIPEPGTMLLLGTGLLGLAGVGRRSRKG